MNAIWGFLLALFLALAGEYLAGVIAPALGLQKGAISGIMMAILLGILVNNLFKLPEVLRPASSSAWCASCASASCCSASACPSSRPARSASRRCR